MTAPSRRIPLSGTSSTRSSRTQLGLPSPSPWTRTDCEPIALTLAFTLRRQHQAEQRVAVAADNQHRAVFCPGSDPPRRQPRSRRFSPGSALPSRSGGVLDPCGRDVRSEDVRAVIGRPGRTRASRQTTGDVDDCNWRSNAGPLLHREGAEGSADLLPHACHSVSSIIHPPVGNPWYGRRRDLDILRVDSGPDPGRCRSD